MKCVVNEIDFFENEQLSKESNVCRVEWMEWFVRSLSLMRQRQWRRTPIWKKKDKNNNNLADSKGPDGNNGGKRNDEAENQFQCWMIIIFKFPTIHPLLSFRLPIQSYPLSLSNSNIEEEKNQTNTQNPYCYYFIDSVSIF